MAVDYGLVAELLSVILAFLATYFGAKLKKAKGVLGDLAKALDDTYKALEDNTITPDELKQLIQDWKKLIKDVK